MELYRKDRFNLDFIAYLLEMKTVEELDGCFELLILRQGVDCKPTGLFHGRPKFSTIAAIYHSHYINSTDPLGYEKTMLEIEGMKQRHGHKTEYMWARRIEAREMARNFFNFTYILPNRSNYPGVNKSLWDRYMKTKISACRAVDKLNKSYKNVEYGLACLVTTGDGNCQFNAIARGLTGTEAFCVDLRLLTYKYLKQKYYGFMSETNTNTPHSDYAKRVRWETVKLNIAPVWEANNNYELFSEWFLDWMAESTWENVKNEMRSVTKECTPLRNEASGKHSQYIWTGAEQAFGACNVLKRPIIIIPGTAEIMCGAAGIFLPVDHDPRDCNKSPLLVHMAGMHYESVAFRLTAGDTYSDTVRRLPLTVGYGKDGLQCSYEKVKRRKLMVVKFGVVFQWDDYEDDNNNEGLKARKREAIQDTWDDEEMEALKLLDAYMDLHFIHDPNHDDNSRIKFDQPFPETRKLNDLIDIFPQLKRDEYLKYVPFVNVTFRQMAYYHDIVRDSLTASKN